MDPFKNTPTCISCLAHDGDSVTDKVQHYFSCLSDRQKHEYWGVSLGSDETARENIIRERRRVETIRKAIADDSTQKGLLRALECSLRDWRAGPRPKRLTRRSNSKGNYEETIPKQEKSLAPDKENDSDTGTNMDQESALASGASYNPDEHTYGYVAEFMDEFHGEDVSGGKRKGRYRPVPRAKSGMTTDDPGQRISVSSLLGDESPLSRTSLPGNGLKWIHFPANNMDWIERAVAKYYREERKRTDKDFQHQSASRAQMLLRPQFWRNQQYGGTDSDPQGRHMRSLCEVVLTDTHGTPAEALVLFMPYVHWERFKESQAFSDIIHTESLKHTRKLKAEATEGAEVQQHQGEQLQRAAMDGEGNERTRNTIFGGIGVWRSDTGDEPRTMTDTLGQSDGHFVRAIRDRFSQRIIPRDASVGRVFLDAAKLYDAFANFRDKQMVRKYLFSNPPLHPRRSLNQADYWARSMPGREMEQTVYRATTPIPGSFHRFDRVTGLWPASCRYDGRQRCMDCRDLIRKVSRVLTVDQLWMWVLDEDTVITAFPQRYGLRDDEDVSGVHNAILNKLASPSTIITSIFDLANIIIGECCNSFFDPTNFSQIQPQALKMFSDSTAVINHKKRVASEHFRYWSHTYTKSRKSAPVSSFAESQDSNLDVTAEITLICQIQDILDEIDIIESVFRTQLEVVDSLERNQSTISYGRWREQEPADPGTPRFGRDLGTGSTTAGFGTEPPRMRAPWSMGDTEHAEGVGAEPSASLGESRNPRQRRWFRVDASDISRSIRGRLAALRRIRDGGVHAYHGIKDLLDLKDKQMTSLQAWAASRQTAETISVFTVVSTIFLPLSFMTSVFGMNSKELDVDTERGYGWSMSEQFKLIFSISIAVTFIILLFAFNIYFNALVRLTWDFLIVRPSFRVMVHLFGQHWWVSLRTFAMTDSKQELERWKAGLAKEKMLQQMRRRGERTQPEAAGVARDAENTWAELRNRRRGHDEEELGREVIVLQSGS